jgi:hypothetical protein
VKARIVMPALLLLLLGCDDQVSFPGGSLLDDDDRIADDDDTADDDDDDATNDDDAAGDDDDASTDDDDASDDDDTDPPFVGATYCLDWGSVDVVEPAGIFELLTQLSDIFDAAPPILVPTSVDIAAQEIRMDVGVADNDCAPDSAIAQEDLTPNGPGSYVAPHFEAGPGDMNLGGSVLDLILQDATVTGDFTGTSDAIINSTLTGALDLSAAFGACAIVSCGPCPDGGNQCVSFAATSAVWNRAN